MLFYGDSSWSKDSAEALSKVYYAAQNLPFSRFIFAKVINNIVASSKESSRLMGYNVYQVPQLLVDFWYFDFVLLRKEIIGEIFIGRKIVYREIESQGCFYWQNRNENGIFRSKIGPQFSITSLLKKFSFGSVCP